jgi:hypothetical protein
MLTILSAMPWWSFGCGFDMMAVGTRKLTSIRIRMIASEREVILHHVWFADTAVRRA